jgi:dipeptidyl aminopeptidase/acylaminoacyl peptidase
VPYVVDGGRRWAAICEARQDDDGNGKLQVMVMQHGDTGGDELRPYLVLGAGKGAEIDDFVASDPKGRWVVTTKDMCVHLVDTETGKAVALRGADGRPGDEVSGDHRAASFSPDGKALLYIKSDGARSIVVQRDLGTGAERAIDPGPGELSRAFFDRSGRFVVMEVVARDTNGDGLLTQPRVSTTLGSRRCRAPVTSASFYGQIGDKPVQRVAPVAGGAVRDAAAGPPLSPSDRPPPRYDLASKERRALGRGDSLPAGPFHWEVTRPSER